MCYCMHVEAAVGVVVTMLKNIFGLEENPVEKFGLELKLSV